MVILLPSEEAATLMVYLKPSAVTLSRVSSAAFWITLTARSVLLVVAMVRSLMVTLPAQFTLIARVAVEVKVFLLPSSVIFLSSTMAAEAVTSSSRVTVSPGRAASMAASRVSNFSVPTWAT